ncbi:unnamed protein product [Phytophthora fragariaefolia]|uniref:Unnamed protein product n=1 Tax=Phytophthora fragariaefolia TaxID=1490495 RepID=A0A9W6XV95_9STRA|nr:unnamed protein product [Phytophthora fragariaefolia]
MVRLFWLEGKNYAPSRCGRFSYPDVFSEFETAVEESIRANNLEYKSPLHHRSDDYLSCMKDVEIQRATLDFHRKHPTSGKRGWIKLPFKPSRVTPCSTLGVAKMKQPEIVKVKGSQHMQSVKDTASEMERAFRIEHNRDSTPQFCTTLCMCAVYLLITIIYTSYRNGAYPDEAARKARAYTIYCITIVLLLTIVKLLRKYPRLARLKEWFGTGTGIVFIAALNVQQLRESDTTSFKDSQPRGEQTITLLDGNLLYAVVVGLVIRLRFRNAVRVNAWSFVVYVVCSSLRRAEEWADMSESFFLIFTVAWISVHFGYKRELGLRHDFLLQCRGRCSWYKEATLSHLG